MTSIWQNITDRAGQLRYSFEAFFERVSEIARGKAEPRDPRMTEAFSVAFIGLAAKLSKADGLVSLSEIRTFRAIFHVPDDQVANVGRLFDQCAKSTAGFDVWAMRMAKCLSRSPNGAELAHAVLDGLVRIAFADDELDQAEEDYLWDVAEILGIPEDQVEGLIQLHNPARNCPFSILGLRPGANEAEIRTAWKRAVRDHHPDRLMAQGMPPEMLIQASARMAEINEAHALLLRRRPSHEVAVEDDYEMSM